MQKKVIVVLVGLFLIVGLQTCNLIIEKRAVNSVMTQILNNNQKYRQFKWTELMNSSPSDRAFVVSLYAINVILCPKDFKVAFYGYANAWKEIVESSEKYAGLNGTVRILTHGPEFYERTAGMMNLGDKLNKAALNLQTIAAKYTK